jgi:hypothetical protein
VPLELLHRAEQREREKGYSPFQHTIQPLTFLYSPHTSADTRTATITVVLQGKLFFVNKERVVGDSRYKRECFGRGWVNFVM